MSITDRILDALRSAILLEAKVTTVANSVADISKDVRDIDKRLVRIETFIEFGTRAGPPSTPPTIEDGRP